MFATNLKKHFSFAQSEDAKDTNRVFLVRGCDSTNNLAWYYVLVDREKCNMFKAQSGTDTLDILQYGTIIRSGYGEEPPKHIKDFMFSEYRFTS